MISNKKIMEIYDLNYDKSNINSGLIQWYNKLIEKRYDEINVVDVSKMVRQDVLKEIAVTKAVELFCNDPYDGEMYDGDLLNLIVSFGESTLSKFEKNKELLKTIDSLSNEYSDFEWINEDKKLLFEKNLQLLKNYLNKL